MAQAATPKKSGLNGASKMDGLLMEGLKMGALEKTVDNMEAAGRAVESTPQASEVAADTLLALLRCEERIFHFVCLSDLMWGFFGGCFGR